MNTPPDHRVTRHTIRAGTVKLAAFTRGNPSSTPVVLVHGYPDTHAVWDAAAEVLARRFYVITYDVRGAGESERPGETRDYTLHRLSADQLAVLDALIPGRAAHLVGHDWGSIQTWETVTEPRLQQRILSYTTLSGPCLDHAGHWMRERLRAGSVVKVLRQLAKSWYIGTFHLPVVAPMVWRALGPAWPEVMRQTEQLQISQTPTRTRDAIDGIHLYRANMLPRLLRPRVRRTQLPVQLIVGRRDNFMHPQLFEDLATWAPHLRRRDVDAGHWGLVHDGERLAGWIQEFIADVEMQRRA